MSAFYCHHCEAPLAAPAGACDTCHDAMLTVVDTARAYFATPWPSRLDVLRRAVLGYEARLRPSTPPPSAPPVSTPEGRQAIEDLFGHIPDPAAPAAPAAAPTPATAPIPITDAQVRALQSIGRTKGLTVDALEQLAQERYGVPLAGLDIERGSDLIKHVQRL
ncbi:MAG TPA: hypothetical protein VF406_21235 [Thermodesulfobacteriota bacterium]